MATNKKTNTNIIAPKSKDSHSQQASPECCMCGDHGVSNELFQCRVCRFRSQHRYCSNLYPKAESYQVCNWCLSQKDGKDRSQNSSNSSSSKKSNGQEDDNKNKSNNNRVVKIQRSNLQLQHQLNKPIKKQRSSPERSPLPLPSPSPATRKRIITNGALEEKKKKKKLLKRTKSDINTVMIRKPVFKTKVRLRRYKLLEEVSC